MPPYISQHPTPTQSHLLHTPHPIPHHIPLDYTPTTPSPHIHLCSTSCHATLYVPHLNPHSPHTTLYYTSTHTLPTPHYTTSQPTLSPHHTIPHLNPPSPTPHYTSLASPILLHLKLPIHILPSYTPFPLPSPPPPSNQVPPLLCLHEEKSKSFAVNILISFQLTRYSLLYTYFAGAL